MRGTETLDRLKAGGLTEELLEAEFLSKMKEQERLAVQALIKASESQIKNKRVMLGAYLQAAAEELKGYATEAAANIKGGLEGEAGQAADTYLTQTVQKPSFKNPIKS